MFQAAVFFKRSTLAISLSALLVACAHQTTITPSTGHIDGKNTAPNQKKIPDVVEDNKAAAPAKAPKNTSANNAEIPAPITSEVYLPPPKPTQKTANV